MYFMERLNFRVKCLRAETFGARYGNYYGFAWFSAGKFGLQPTGLGARWARDQCALH